MSTRYQFPEILIPVSELYDEEDRPIFDFEEENGRFVCRNCGAYWADFGFRELCEPCPACGTPLGDVG